MKYQSVLDLLKIKTLENPSKEFLCFESTQCKTEFLTYEEFLEQVNKLAMVLKKKGISKGDKVLLHLPNGTAFMKSWFAVLTLGAVMVPTNILSTRDEMDHLIRHSESKLILTERIFAEKFRDFNLPCIFSRLEKGEEGTSLESEIESTEELLEFPSISLSDEAAIMYTSGTTSKPKGVVLTHQNYLHTGEKMVELLHYTNLDRMLIVLPLFHGNAQYYMAMPALYAGASIAITETFSATNYIKQAKRLKATVGSLFSAPIKMILKKEYDSEDAVNELRLILYAQALTERQYDEFSTRYQTPLRQLYGMTETVAVPLMNRLDSDYRTIGQEACGFQVVLRDEQGQEVPDGEAGEITVYGIPGVTIMKEYFRNSEATAITLRNNWLYTGDMAKKSAASNFYFVDRKKDMIKRAGENIAAGEIEATLNEHEAVFESAVTSVPDSIYDEAIHAFVILKEGKAITEKEIIEWCSQRLAKFKIPQAIHFVSNFPRTSVGKIQKQHLKP